MKANFLIVISLLLVCTGLFGQNKNSFEHQWKVLGTYLWEVPQEIDDKYWDFAQQNHVTEIYLTQYKANFPNSTYEELTKKMINKANKQNLKVFRLIAGRYHSIEDFDKDTLKIDAEIEQTIKYNQSVPDSMKFAGINVDIEFGDKSRYQKYLDCVVIRLCRKYKNQISIDFYIGNYQSPVRYQGKQVELYKAVIEEADRTFIQSYKSTAKEMYEYAQLFLNYAKTKNKTIILGAETGCYNKHKNMYEELNKLSERIKDENAGLQIHTLTNWYHDYYVKQ